MSPHRYLTKTKAKKIFSKIHVDSRKIVFIILALVFTLSGLSCTRDDVVDEFGKMLDSPKTSTKKQDTSRVKEGQVFPGMVSLRSEITDGDEGEWEWIWVCQEGNYNANWVKISVAHYGSLDMKALTAGQIFNNNKKLILEEMTRVYTGQNTDREYFQIVQKIEEDNIVGYIIWYPNQGEISDFGTYMGTYQGSFVCFRGPKCVASATIHIMRPITAKISSVADPTGYAGLWQDNIVRNLMNEIQILDNE
jgi:hypothetical protein